ncbi:hypothetical protein LOTGIDRAFT_238251 [Lottia gigantea]|uniref:Transmembrane protein 177 n=1 Tax=Lottia gigantea TaxID=225164 RepID=V4CHG6_LOTGI|nr:hypothetical protein LOTGIDRAFT_238251 [Lottia gigantea]ESP01565.1 hypothetical protein LOTGIDRAFT_238251 [Lottia gigantea]
MSLLRAFIQEATRRMDIVVSMAAGGFTGVMVLKDEYYAKNVITVEGHEGKPGSLTPLDTESEQLGYDVIKSIKVDKVHAVFVNYFTTKRPEVISKGTPLLCQGVFIGVPYCFRFKSADEIKTADLQFFDRGVDLDTENVQNLFDTMIYTELEKKFAVSQELFNKYSYLALLQPTSAAVAATVWYIVCYFFFNPMFYIKRHVSLRNRAFLYFICNCIGVKIALWGHNRLLQFRDHLTIRKTVDADKEMALAGLTYYQKCLERNKMLYSLPGSAFKDKLDSQGNFLYPIYEQRISLTNRHLYLMETLKRKGLLVAGNCGKMDLSV